MLELDEGQINYQLLKNMFMGYMTEAQFTKLKQEQLRNRYLDIRRVEEVFPNIEKIEISYQLQHGSAFGTQSIHNMRTVTPQDQAIFVFDCLNRECSSSGFDLKIAILSMYRLHQAESIGEMHCHGQEAPDHPEQSCDGKLTYRIMIYYKL